jgi:hypothetical protein
MVGVARRGVHDKDNFAVDFGPGALGENERRLVLAAALYIDLMSFEKKASAAQSLAAINFE